MADTPPFEDVMSTKLPNYPSERRWLGFFLVATFLFWLVFMPNLVDRICQRRQARSQSAVKINAVSFISALVCGISCLASLCMVLWQSSNNSVIARAVFEAPLLSSQECDVVLEFAYQAAERNFVNATLQSTTESDDSLLKEPVGWHKTRHKSFPTTDLNLKNDPFSDEAREWIGDKLDRRLAPLLSSIYGIPARSIRAHDMFVVRYSYDAQERTSLERHSDSGDVSFNILLSDDFKGGGTRFWRAGAPFALLKPPKGCVLINPAWILHEGMPIESGDRHILVGFLSVDKVNPITAQQTGLGWFASWLSLPWLHARLKQVYKTLMVQRHSPVQHDASWTTNVYVTSLFRDLVTSLQYIGDLYCPHFHVKLVDDDKASDYLAAMDTTFDEIDAPRAMWFQGQQLDVNDNSGMSSQTRQEL